MTQTQRFYWVEIAVVECAVRIDRCCQTPNNLHLLNEFLALTDCKTCRLIGEMQRLLGYASKCGKKLAQRFTGEFWGIMI